MKHKFIIAIILILGQVLPQAQNLRFSNLEKVEDGMLTVWLYVENNSLNDVETLQGFNLRYYYKSSELSFVDSKIDQALLDAGFMQIGGNGDNLFLESDVSRSGSADRFVGFAPFVFQGGLEISPKSGDERKLIQIGTLRFRTLGDQSTEEIESFQIGTEEFTAVKYTSLPGCVKGCDLILVEAPSSEETEVDVTEFTGFKLGLYDSKLIWETKGEELVNQYEIQRRKKGDTSWEGIAIVPVESSVKGSRSYVDKGVYDGFLSEEAFEYRIELNYRNNGQGLTDIETVNFAASKSIIEVYPNPASTDVHIQLDPVITETELDLTIFNAVGKVVFTKKISQDSRYEHIDLRKSQVTSGTYVIRLSNSEMILDHHQIEVVR